MRLVRKTCEKDATSGATPHNSKQDVLLVLFREVGASDSSSKLHAAHTPNDPELRTTSRESLA